MECEDCRYYGDGDWSFCERCEMKNQIGAQHRAIQELLAVLEHVRSSPPWVNEEIVRTTIEKYRPLFPRAS